MLTSQRNEVLPTCKDLWRVRRRVLIRLFTGRYLRRLQEAAAASTAPPDEQNLNEEPPASPVSSASAPAKCNSSRSGSSPSSLLERSSNTSPPMTAPAVPPSRYPIAADTYHQQYHLDSVSPTSYNDSLSTHANRNPTLPSRPASKHEDPSHDSFSPYSQNNWYKQNYQPHVPPPLSFWYRPRRLEEIAPRDTISLIIALFFDFVYPLTPCVHKPSFMADLHARREERDPLFFALVMSTVASTLVQVPRSYLPMTRPAVRKLAQVIASGSPPAT